MAQNPPKLGVQYVAGAAPQSPILRPVRTRIYDREQVGGGIVRTRFFDDNRRTADGRTKTECFTNMTQCGMLGCPLEFDLVSLSISPVAGDREYAEIYWKFINSDYVLRWFFGHHSIFEAQPISLMRTRGATGEILIDKVTKKPYRLTVRNGKAVPVEVDQYDVPQMDMGERLSERLQTRYIDVRTPDGKARRIDSTTSFHGELFRDSGFLGDRIDIYLCMDGIIYRQL